MDFGPRQIGLAVSDETGFLARPLRSLTVERIREAPEAVAAVAREEEAGAIVVGMPVGLEGEEHRLEKAKSITFKFRVYAHAGDSAEGKVAAVYEGYVNSKVTDGGR